MRPQASGVLLIAALCGLGCGSDAVPGGAASAGRGMGGSHAGAGTGGASAGKGGAGAPNGGAGVWGSSGAFGSAAGQGTGGGAGMAGAGGASGGAAMAGASGGGAGAIGAAGASAGGMTGAGAAGRGGAGGSNTDPVSLTILDEVTFYDGYANVSNEPVPGGAKRLRNDLITRKLSDEELDSIRNTLHVEVVIGALCDNYDRIGSVALAFVPKGMSTYQPDSVERIEVGRYITPFMDFNREPKQVSYEYDVDHLVPVLHDAEIRGEFDLWAELELFGVPYAANDEVAGCANRSDVFHGSLIFASDGGAPAASFDELVPLTYKAPLNNYEQGATDMLGKTRKTVEFELAADTADTQLVLITSNHGANSGGEEYSRRDHFVYVDDEAVLMYKPGRKSCEPFRNNNTQANGIYGNSPRSDSDWQSFSNWCPGDVIDTRVIPLGPQTAGSHEFAIEVPDAKFQDGEGNIPFSLYLQSRRP